MQTPHLLEEVRLDIVSDSIGEGSGTEKIPVFMSKDERIHGEQLDIINRGIAARAIHQANLAMYQTHEQDEDKADRVEKLAAYILADPERRKWYDEAKMHWIGDPDPVMREDGRHPWVKRTIDGNEYVYSQPVIAASSDTSLMSVRKDPWHRDDNPNAWFVGLHDLTTGEVKEPMILRAHVSKYGQMFLQLADRKFYHNWPAKSHPAYHQPASHQRRVEAWLTPDYHAAKAEYRNGLQGGPVQFEDIVALESAMRAMNERHGLQLPDRLAAERSTAPYYELAA